LLFLMKLGKIIRNREKSMFSCWFKHNQDNFARNPEKYTFCFFWWNWEKSSEIVRKASFHANSDKIRQILLEIGKKLLFAFFMKPGKIIKNCEKSMFSCWFKQNRYKITFCFFLVKLGKIIRNRWGKQVFMLILTKSGKFYWKSGENYFLLFLMKPGKIIKNREKSMVSCWFKTKSGQFC